MLIQVVSRVAVLAPVPDNITAVLRLNPAGRHPVQRTTQAGRTPCPALLISCSIQVTRLYLQVMYKTKVQKLHFFISQLIFFPEILKFSK